MVIAPIIFKIIAKDIAGNEAISSDRYVHVPDLIAPDPPEKFSGFIDDEGTVTLYWEHSSSEDAVGYWVYFANRRSSEFTSVNSTLITENAYSYQISVKTLNSRIYYMVATEDVNSNRGENNGKS